MILDTPESIHMFCLLSMKGRLKLEIKGFKFRGRTTYSIIKQRFGFRGNRAKVLKQLEAHIDDMARPVPSHCVHRLNHRGMAQPDPRRS